MRAIRSGYLQRRSRTGGQDGDVNRPLSPSTIAPPAARYAHAVLTEGRGRLLHTSGVVPTAPDGSVPPDLGEQAAVVWSNIAAILAEAAMHVADIVSVTTYVVVGNELGPVMAARDAAFGDHVAASTLVTVPALARPEWLMEVAIVAAAT
jgi:enamine deaminase RidA (YjgF/YER057c/UK114 family)